MNLPSVFCSSTVTLSVFFILCHSQICASEPLFQRVNESVLPRQQRDVESRYGTANDCFQNCIHNACYSAVSTSASATTSSLSATTTTASSRTSICSAVSAADIAYFPLTVAAPTESQIAEIVDVHNDYRRSAPAKNMRKLSWSACAASNAQHWADTCPSDHDIASPRRIPGYPYCGQNIAWNTGSVPMSWTQTIRLWYDEVHDFNYCAAPMVSGVVGHYTQVMWADTSLLGCGMKAGCPAIPSLGLSPGPVNVFVCNYCTGGNIVTGTNTYPDVYCPWEASTSPSETCSHCPSGTACSSGDTLCV